jgi:hypothetical protein
MSARYNEKRSSIRFQERMIMKRWMVCIGMAIWLLSGCGTMTVHVEYDNATATSSSNEYNATTTPSLNELGELGWIEISGVLRDSSGAPLVGESVFCPNELCLGTRYTDANGRFSFGPVFLRASDIVVLWAIPSSYALMEMQRPGPEVWEQPEFEFVFPVPPTPPASELSAGDLGWITVTGAVRDASGMPIAGGTVACLRVSENQPYVYSNRQTNTSGGFSCDTTFIRNTDSISVQVIANGFADQEITRSGVELWQNSTFNFVFSQQVTPTPYLDPFATATPYVDPVSTATLYLNPTPSATPTPASP